MSITEPNKSALWMALALVLVAAGGIVANQRQEGDVALLRQTVTTLESRLASIENKLDRLLEGQRAAR